MGARFQELFHSPPGVLFTFPSRYSFAIGQTGIFRLTQRSGLIHTGFHETRATWENTIGRRLASRYGALTLYGPVFNPVPLANRFMHSRPARRNRDTRSRNTRAQPPTGITRNGLAIIRFRSPLLTEYPFLQVLRCFTSLRTPRPRRCRPMTAGGFPIRKPSDQSHVGGSPRIIASSNVLHRYCLPRHPPYALASNTTAKRNCHCPTRGFPDSKIARRQILTLK